MTELDRFVLGANPLMGVDHYLPQRAREKALFLNNERMVSVIIQSLRSGAQGFNFGASPATYDLLTTLRESNFDESLGLYPIVPDLQAYVSSQLKKGTLGMISDALDSLSWSAKVSTLIRGGLSVIESDPVRMMNVFLGVAISKLKEVSPHSASLKSVFVHEAVTDLVVLLGIEEVFNAYVSYVRSELGVMPGFVTRNLPLFVDFCKEIDLELDKIVIMTPFNKVGFQMAPTRTACEQTLNTMANAHVMAMSVLAAGQVSLRQAIDYLNSLPNIDSVVVGVSSEGHAQTTFPMLRQELKPKVR